MDKYKEIARKELIKKLEKLEEERRQVLNLPHVLAIKHKLAYKGLYNYLKGKIDWKDQLLNEYTEDLAKKQFKIDELKKELNHVKATTRQYLDDVTKVIHLRAGYTILDYTEKLDNIPANHERHYVCTVKTPVGDIQKGYGKNLQGAYDMACTMAYKKPDGYELALKAGA